MDIIICDCCPDRGKCKRDYATCPRFKAVYVTTLSEVSNTVQDAHRFYTVAYDMALGVWANRDKLIPKKYKQV